MKTSSKLDQSFHHDENSPPSLYKLKGQHTENFPFSLYKPYKLYKPKKGQPKPPLSLIVRNVSAPIDSYTKPPRPS